MKDTLDSVLGIVIATIVAVILRWSARRWPLPGEHDDDDRDRPRRPRRRPDLDPQPDEE